MRAPEGRDLGMLALAVALLALASPLRVLWLSDTTQWWLPFAIWGGVIALGAVAARREGS